MTLQGSVYNYYTFTTSFEVAGNHMSWQTCTEVCKLVVHRRGRLGSDSQVIIRLRFQNQLKAYN